MSTQDLFGMDDRRPEHWVDSERRIVLKYLFNGVYVPKTKCVQEFRIFFELGGKDRPKVKIEIADCIQPKFLAFWSLNRKLVNRKNTAFNNHIQDIAVVLHVRGK